MDHTVTLRRGEHGRVLDDHASNKDWSYTVTRCASRVEWRERIMSSGLRSILMPSHLST